MLLRVVFGVNGNNYYIKMHVTLVILFFTEQKQLKKEKQQTKDLS